MGSWKYLLIYIASSLSIQLLIKRTIVAYPFNIKFLAFYLYYFFDSKFFLICFFAILFRKNFQIFSPLRRLKNIGSLHSVFNFYNYKNFISIANIAFCKHSLKYNIIIMIINFFTRVNIPGGFILTGFILIVLWYVLY